MCCAEDERRWGVGGMISGFVAWGNGEPCPYCEKMIPDEEHVKHLFDEHRDEMMGDLFPK